MYIVSYIYPSSLSDFVFLLSSSSVPGRFIFSLELVYREVFPYFADHNMRGQGKNNQANTHTTVPWQKQFAFFSFRLRTLFLYGCFRCGETVHCQGTSIVCCFDWRSTAQQGGSIR